MDDEHFEKTLHASAGLNGDEDPYGMEDCKPVTLFSFNAQFLFEHPVACFHLMGIFVFPSWTEEKDDDETAARGSSEV